MFTYEEAMGEASPSPRTQPREFTYEEVMGKASPSPREAPKTKPDIFDQIDAEEKEKAAQIKSLRSDLNGAIDDLKAKWFPKRTKVENYDIIAKTLSAICRVSDWNVDEMNSWGLSQFDISEIYKASSALNQGRKLEIELDSLQRKNSRLSEEIMDAKHASREAANESREAAYESRRAASAADDATFAAQKAERKARDAEDAATSRQR